MRQQQHLLIIHQPNGKCYWQDGHGQIYIWEWASGPRASTLIEGTRLRRREDYDPTVSDVEDLFSLSMTQYSVFV